MRKILFIPVRSFGFISIYAQTDSTKPGIPALNSKVSIGCSDIIHYPRAAFSSWWGSTVCIKVHQTYVFCITRPDEYVNPKNAVVSAPIKENFWRKTFPQFQSRKTRAIIPELRLYAYKKDV